MGEGVSESNGCGTLGEVVDRGRVKVGKGAFGVGWGVEGTPKEARLR